MTRHRELIERKASLLQIQESRDARVQFQASFAALEREANLAKTRAVISWLSAADGGPKSRRFRNSKTGRSWEVVNGFLEEPKVK